MQEGCNFACSYCIIPTARGRSRSVPPERVLEQVRGLAEAGFAEIVLTGIHLGGYGYDLAPRVSLSELVRRIAGSGLIPRLRLSSLDPREVTDELLSVMAESEVICPHLHVCVQAGDDGILKRMRRNYDTAFFARLMARARGKLPRAALGTDVIVGFPGESEDAFSGVAGFPRRRAADLLSRVSLFVPPGHPRGRYAGPGAGRREEGTLAPARGSWGRARSRSSTAARWGGTCPCWREEPVPGEPGWLKGYSRNYLPVLFPGGLDLLHREVPVTLREWSRGRLRGEARC